MALVIIGILGVLIMLILAALFLTTLCEELKKEKSSNGKVFLCIFGALIELCGAMLLISLARNLI